MSLWKWLLVMVAALCLAACGGGGSNAGTPLLGGSSGSVADVVIAHLDQFTPELLRTLPRGR